MDRLQTLTEKPTDASSTNLESINGPTTTKEVTALDPGAPLADQSNVLPFRQLMIVYTGLALAMFLAALDQLIVTTAAPKSLPNLMALP
ncbi:hypothetical protein BC937DRAFT_91174 [Endogone sp. FLAS-F59071]|nr:hypothetical protein BC937DRAFT_91174 [Endogone sp. FLAS-F59071]|eukprot:RUS21890.1 hypothetical protein BC937DRAFT_91174 [Endogone sp. FLAS-F59071]